MMDKVWPKVFVSAAALAALIFAILRNVEVQVGIVALLVLAAFPWLAAAIESIDLPGGGSLRMRQINERIQRQDELLNVQGEKVEQHNQKVQSQDKQLHMQQQILNKLVVYSLSWYLFKMLATFYHLERSEAGEYLFRDDDRMRQDLRFLRDHGYLEHFTIAELRDGENLVGKIRLTPVGNYLVELREPPREPEAVDVAQQLGVVAAAPVPD
jgi:hypothetical protein